MFGGFLRSALVILLGVSISAEAAEEKASIFIFYREQSINQDSIPEVWKIWPSGRMERIGAEFGKMRLAGGDIIASPDGHWLAFAREGDIWIHDVKNGKSEKATAIASVATETSPGREFVIVAWAPDSRRVLLRENHWAPPPNDDEGIMPESGGFFILDRASGKVSPVSLPSSVGLYGWMGNRGFISGPKPTISIGSLWNFSLGKGELEVITRDDCQYGQPYADSSGKHILAVRSCPNLPNCSHQVVEISVANPPDQNIETLTECGRWGEFQWPTFSPTGKRISYFHQGPIDAKGRHTSTLIADNRPAFETCSDGRMDMAWIDDDHIASFCSGMLVLIDLASNGLKPENRDGR